MRLHETKKVSADTATTTGPNRAEALSGRCIVARCLNMIARPLQFIFAALLLSAAVRLAPAELETGSAHRLTFRDVDGRDLSTSDGHVTIITVVTRQDEGQAHTVADQVPDRCLGDPKYRYITLVNFQRKLSGPLQSLTRAIIRGRLDAEAKKLKPKYEAKHLTRDPRKDVYVVADFDGAAVARLGLAPEARDVVVFVFDGAGKLVGQWKGVPSEGALAKAILTAR